jgi:monoamine oxidase
MAGRAEADVVVVGAGLAGLTAGRELQRAGYSVLVVEAWDRVGGRVLSHSRAGGDVVDVGGPVLWGLPQRHVLGLAAELGVATVPIFTKGRTLLELGGRRYGYRVIPGRPGSASRRRLAILTFDRMARRVPVQGPWQAAGAAAADSQTLADWARGRVRTRLGRFAVEAFSQGVLAPGGANPEPVEARVAPRMESPAARPDFGGQVARAAREQAR